MLPKKKIQFKRVNEIINDMTIINAKRHIDDFCHIKNLGDSFNKYKV